MKRRKRLRFAAIILCALYAGWVILALALPPTLVRSSLQDWLAAALQAPVTVEDIRLNPLTLQATLSGIRVPIASEPLAAGAPLHGQDTAGTKEGGSLLAVEKVILSPSLRFAAPASAAFAEQSVWERLLSLRPQVALSLRLVQPNLDIAYLGDGLFSFSALLPPPQEKAESPAMPLLALSDLRLEKGTFTLRDKVTGVALTLDSIRFEVPFVAPPPSLFDHSGAKDEPLASPTLSARLNGTPIHVGGSLHPVLGPDGSTSLRTSFEILAGTLDLEPFSDFLSRFTPLKIISGRVEPTLTLVLSQPSSGEVNAEVSGRLHVEDIDIAGPSGESVGRLARGEIALAGFTLHERRIALKAMELDGLYLKIKREKDGSLDWEKWFEQIRRGQERRLTAEETSSVSPATPFVVEGADLTLRNADFVWEDAAFSGAGRISVTGVDGRIAEFSTRPGARTAMRLSFGIDKEGMLALDGEGTLTPPSLQASLTVQDLSLVVLHPLLGGTLFADLAGRLDLAGDVRAGTEKNSARLSLAKGKAALRELAFGKGTGKSPAIAVQSLDCKAFSLDTAARKLDMDALSLSGPQIRLAAGKGLTLSVPGRKPGVSPAAGAEGASPEKPGKPLSGWQGRIAAINLNKGKVFYVDAKGRTETLVSDLSLGTGPLSFDPGQAIDFTLRSKGRRKDTLALDGKLRPSPLRLDARVQAASLELDTLTPVLQRWTHISPKGQAEGDLRLSFARLPDHTAPVLDLTGDLSLRNLRLSDSRSGKSLGQARRISVQKLRFALEEPLLEHASLEAADLLLDRLRLPLEITAKGSLVLLDALLDGSGVRHRGSDKLFKRLRLDALRIQDAGFFISDRRFTPAVALAVQNLNVELRGLDSRPGTSASVRVSALLDGAPLLLEGHSNPLTTPPTADLSLVAEDVDLSRYSAYARQYMGYPIEQGRLRLKSRIVTSRRDFSADSELLLQKLSLGPKDTRPGAPDYPLPLGLSLLADLNGDISVKAPLRGSLDGVHPEMGGIVGKAIGGLFGKILTAPFSLVGGLFGFLGESEPELQLIPFSPGSASLSPISRQRADKVADLLRLRPKATVRLVGLYEETSDSAGLCRADVLHRLQALKYASLTKAEQAACNPRDVRLAPEEYEELLFRAYKEADIPDARKVLGITRREDPDVMEKRLQSLTRLAPEDLGALALARAEAVRAHILSRDSSLAQRVSLATDRNGAPETRTGSARVEVQVR